MGAWGGLCVFDAARYRDQLLPALRSGEADPLIAACIQALNARRRARQRTFTGLADVMSTCAADGRACGIGRDFAVPDAGGAIWGYEDLAELFERVLTTYAISDVAVTGLAFTSTASLFPEELGLDDLTALLLADLDVRCAYWASGSGGYGEGIRGWLDPADTALLDAGLSAFDGPALPHESCALAWGRLWACVAERNAPQWAEAEYVRHAGHISAFRAIVRRAAELGRGVLWGRDLRLFYGELR